MRTKKSNQTALVEAALLKQEKALNEAGIEVKNKIHYPDYWKKRKHRLNIELVKRLQETANADPVMEDAYGKYKPGTFLYKNYIVTVTYENGLWNVHIFGEANCLGDLVIPQFTIQDVRDRFVPDYCMMLQFFPSREERKAARGVILYEMPGSVEEDKEAKAEETESKDE